MQINIHIALDLLDGLNTDSIIYGLYNGRPWESELESHVEGALF